MTDTETGAWPTRVLRWLRAGYPSGVPQQDYVVLLGLLRRSLTDAEVHQIAGDLAVLASRGTEITTADVERMVGSATLDTASEQDVARVSAHLARGGWPLGGPDAG